jgi:hypothetical protein
VMLNDGTSLQGGFNAVWCPGETGCG